MKLGGKRAQKLAAANLAAGHARAGLERSSTWTRADGTTFHQGDPIRLKRAGTGQHLLEFRWHYRNVKLDTEWIDAADVEVFKGEDGKLRQISVIRPVRPEQVVKAQTARRS